AELLMDLDQLSQIQAARKRLDGGEFGRCVDCRQDIPYERLQAQPAALRCLDCQRKREDALARPSATVS
ncbi:MAG TPA: TraR/DksA C4-type zinc finger protein, partial [Burkholderiales bacterium]|nr:TraR/DksA C4-type zinc finger protein [Burkholderiales bacterium]